MLKQYLQCQVLVKMLRKPKREGSEKGRTDEGNEKTLGVVPKISCAAVGASTNLARNALATE